MTTCKGHRKDGQPCRATIVLDNGYCKAHQDQADGDVAGKRYQSKRRNHSERTLSERIGEQWRNVQVRLPLVGLVVVIVIVLLFLAQVLSDLPTAVDNVRNLIPSAGPTATPNAYDLPVAKLIGDGWRLLKEPEFVNLDGEGPTEAIAQSIETNSSYTATMALDVFGFLPGEGWTSILHLTKMQDQCDIFSAQYGIVDLFKDKSRQLVVWIQCGSGSYLIFDLYRYRGLGAMEPFYRSPRIASGTEAETNRWMESSPLIRENGDFYIAHMDGLYHYTWGDTGLEGTKVTDLELNGVTIEYWLDDEGHPQTSQHQVTLKVGEYLMLKPKEQGNLPEVVRIQYESNGVLEVRSGTFYYAKQAGQSSIYLWGWSDPIITITVVSR